MTAGTRFGPDLAEALITAAGRSVGARSPTQWRI
jgi:hypothetical protein